MADAHAKPNHDYHLVVRAPGRSAALLRLHHGGRRHHVDEAPLLRRHQTRRHVFGAGLIGILCRCSLLVERCHLKDEERRSYPVVQISHRYGMILFIASEVMFFVAWFWAFFDASSFPALRVQFSRVEFTGGIWPPKGIEALDPWHFPLLNTLILLTSGATVTWAHHSLLHRRPLRSEDGADPDHSAGRCLHRHSSL